MALHRHACLAAALTLTILATAPSTQAQGARAKAPAPAAASVPSGAATAPTAATQVLSLQTAPQIAAKTWLLVDVKGADGKVTTWGFEAEGPSTLTRAGIRRSDFVAGTPITIKGNPHRDGRPAATWASATRLSDKKEFNPRAGFAVR